MSSLTHIDSEGTARMVDVTEKKQTDRRALAKGRISMSEEAFKAVMQNKIVKGNVLETARIAGIMAAKRTSEIIPLCHPLMLTHIQVDFTPDETNLSLEIFASVRTPGQTGVEMEALTAVSAAALTIYDMCKAIDKSMIISGIMLVEKSGGKSGDFKRS
ncbi:cyclic pyranopterin monophosphate synthase MoaC [Desulforegula conservatrix]|uniref:cyclic pyranopterin monophosphate synthase MoaC n=1 Tax=Desulforegula conservatrix TaxID=153026 RepID=UPI000413AFC7|nr:cyclic pyranopterin monophosphate synthase MoaC [Desulforegula conservatrix]